MKKKRDVIIIGGGISGLTTAYNLLKQEGGGACPFQVTILEAEKETGGQARAFEVDSVTVEELAKQVGYSTVGAYSWNSASLGLTNLFVQEQSGAIFAGKHHLLIHTQDGLAYRLPAGNLTKGFAAPMSRWIEDHGGTIVTGAAVSTIERPHGSKRTQVVYVKEGEEHEIEASHVVVATTPPAAARLLRWVNAPWTTLKPVSPVITMVLQLSGNLDPSGDARELGCSREHWTFSVLTDLSKFWPEFAPDRTGNKTVLRCEIGHADLLANGVKADEEELARMVKNDIDRLYPHAERLEVEWHRVYREDKHLYTKWIQGEFAKKPEARDCGKGVFLAGDWTTKGTIGMEAAANSGIEAANHILQAEKLPLIPYADVPLE